MQKQWGKESGIHSADEGSRSQFEATVLKLMVRVEIFMSSLMNSPPGGESELLSRRRLSLASFFLRLLSFNFKKFSKELASLLTHPSLFRFFHHPYLAPLIPENLPLSSPKGGYRASHEARLPKKVRKQRPPWTSLVPTYQKFCLSVCLPVCLYVCVHLSPHQTAAAY